MSRAATPTPQPETVRLDLPAAHKYLNMLAPCVGEMLARAEGLADRDGATYALQLAVQEVCTNIVEHAYGGRGGGRIGVALTLDEAGRCLVAEFLDGGRSFDVDSVPTPDLDAGQVRGYGLFLIRQLVDEVRYTTTPLGNRWRLEKRW